MQECLGATGGLVLDLAQFALLVCLEILKPLIGWTRSFALAAIQRWSSSWEMASGPVHSTCRAVWRKDRHVFDTFCLTIGPRARSASSALDDGLRPCEIRLELARWFEADIIAFGSGWLSRRSRHWRPAQPPAASRHARRLKSLHFIDVTTYART
jgi:hypothetical protein